MKLSFEMGELSVRFEWVAVGEFRVRIIVRNLAVDDFARFEVLRAVSVKIQVYWDRLDW